MIKFVDLKSINIIYEPEISQAVQRVVNSGWYLLGEELDAFENEYARFISTNHCVGVANGLDALRLILRAYIELGKINEGDEIIVPANTYIASILAVTENRLKPILVEPCIDTYNIDPEQIEDKISVKTKGIMVVHLYGQNAMTPEITRLIEKHNLLLIEDNAQAQGAFFGARRTGSIGHSSGHSFYPGKNLGALGDAGAITTNDSVMAELIKSISNYGSRKKYINDYQGLNSRLDEIQAAVLRVKLKFLDRDNQKRREVANYYLKNIKNDEILLPFIPFKENVNDVLSHVWHLFVIRTSNRNKLQEYLTKKEIQCLIHYPVPPHKQMAFKNWNHLTFPITEKIHNEVLSLPISPTMTINELEYVVAAINAYPNESKAG